jgi:hypothetical protein
MKKNFLLPMRIIRIYNPLLTVFGIVMGNLKKNAVTGKGIPVLLPSRTSVFRYDAFQPWQLLLEELVADDPEEWVPLEDLIFPPSPAG